MHTLLVVILYEYCSFFTFLCIRECRTHTVHTYLVIMFCDCFALHRLSSSRFSSPHQFFHFRLRAKAKVRDCYYCSHRKSDHRLTNSATIFMHVAAWWLVNISNTTGWFKQSLLPQCLWWSIRHPLSRPLMGFRLTFPFIRYGYDRWRDPASSKNFQVQRSSLHLPMLILQNFLKWRMWKRRGWSPSKCCRQPVAQESAPLTRVSV